MSAVYPQSGRKFLAYAATQVKDGIYVAWGSGDAGWSNPPDPASDGDTELTDELGRRKASQAAYVTPVDNGGTAIPTDSGTYYLSNEPTKYLWVLGQFDFADAVGSTIREVGVFGKVALNNGVDDESYITPAQMSDPGLLMAVDRFAGFVRVNTTRQNFDFVIQL